MKWLDVANKRLYFMGIATYKLLMGCVPNYINEIFLRKNRNVRCLSRNISANEIFHIPLHRTNIYRNSAYLQSVYFWHAQPEEITSASSLPVFKIRLYKHLFDVKSCQITSMVRV